jgi:hypothetical protein
VAPAGAGAEAGVWAWRLIVREKAPSNIVARKAFRTVCDRREDIKDLDEA